MLLFSGVYYFDGRSQQKAKVPGGKIFIFPQNFIYLQCIIFYGNVTCRHYTYYNLQYNATNSVVDSFIMYMQGGR